MTIDEHGAVYGGMTKDAYKVFSTQFNQLTGEDKGVSNKQIVIPSFGTTSKILS